MATLTVYPDPDIETTSVDGETSESGSQTWATIIAAAGDAKTDDEGTGYFVRIRAAVTLNDFTYLGRPIILFDTSALTAGATISAAVLSIYGLSKEDGPGWSPTYNIYSSAPASNTALAAGDFDSLGSTAFCDSALTYASWTAEAYNDFTFNATGIAAVSKTGITKLGARSANYDVAAVAPTWGAGEEATIAAYYADTALTTKDPKLVITYTLAATFVPQITMI